MKKRHKIFFQLWGSGVPSWHLEYFFSRFFTEWPEMQKNTKNFCLLNNYSLRLGRKATARAESIWIILAQAVHFPARANTPQTGRTLRRSSVHGVGWLGNR